MKHSLSKTLTITLTLAALSMGAQVITNAPPVNPPDRNLLRIAAVTVRAAPDGTNALVAFTCDTNRLVALQRVTGDTNAQPIFVGRWLNQSAFYTVNQAKQKAQMRVSSQSGEQFLTNSAGRPSSP